MAKKIYEYEICNVFDKDVFTKQCKALEKHISGLTILKSVEDVDGSQIVSYTCSNDETLTVFNDKDFGVYIKSEFDLDKYFT